MAQDQITVTTSGDIHVDEFEAAVRQAWEHARIDDEVVKQFGDLGDVPFEARRDAGQFDVATTIIVPIAAAIGKDVALAIWKEYVWPALKKRFGGRLSSSDAGTV